MADAVTQFSTLGTIDAINAYIAIKQYMLAERNLILARWAETFELPQKMGKTLRVTRHKRLTLPQAPLTEGTPPDAVALSIENVDVVVEQWGIVVLLTDVVQITLTHPALNKATELTALAMAEMFEREIAVMLLAGTNVVYGGTATSRPTLANNQALTTSVVLKTTAALQARGASRFDGQLYAGCIAPQVQADLLGTDTTFQNASNFANVRALQYGEIGIWMQVRWSVSNFLPIYKGVAAIDTAAATAEKSQIAKDNSAAIFTNQQVVNVIVVARDVNSDFERKISQVGSITVDATNTAVKVTTPTSANYTYDIYVGNVNNNTTCKLQFSRVAASTTKSLTGFQATGATPPDAPNTNVEVFVGWVFGKDAFGRVTLNGMSLQSYVTPAGASYSNPLAQGRKVGSKVMWKSFILDNAFFSRIETTSLYGSQLPA